MRDLLRGVPGPKSLAYHVYAGPLPSDHWYADVAQSGGRVIGECCHFLDQAGFLIGARPVQIHAQTTWPAGSSRPHPDSISAQVGYSDGSSAQLIYTAEGDFSFPKETLRVFAAGLVLECENFQRLDVHQGGKSRTRKFSSKGHAEEIAAWLEFLAGRRPHPLPYEEARLSTLLTFSALDSIREGKAVGIP
jgi:predicted dehydrogenase